ALPYFGHLFRVIPFALSLRTYKWPDYISSKYGPIAQFRMVGRATVLINDATVGKRILTAKESDFFRNDFFQKVFEGIAPSGLFVLPSGETWKRHRRLLQPAFGPAMLRTALGVTVECAERLLGVWEKLVEEYDGKTVIDLHEHFTGLSAEVIGKVAFSYEFHLIEKLKGTSSAAQKTEQISGFLNWTSSKTSTKQPTAFEYMERVMNQTTVRLGAPKWSWKMLSIDTASVSKNTKPIFAIIDGAIQKKNQLYSDTTSFRVTSENKWKLDVLDRLILAAKHEQGISPGADQFTDEELMDETLALFFVGHETTGNTLTWAFLQLCENEGVRRRLEEEIEVVLKKSGEGKLTWELLSQLQYHDMFIKEVLRFYSVAPLLGRVAAKDQTILGHHVQKGTRVAVHIKAIHHNPQYWKDPSKFDPERFSPERKDEIVPGSFLPFGDGQMACIGQKMAMVELKAAIFTLLRNYRMKLIPGQNVEPISSITLGLKNGLHVELSRR
ncbi:hypothetical protein HK102_008386, partial [Quaeritorhiza haematococci]